MRMKKVDPDYQSALRKDKASGHEECVRRHAKHVAERKEVAEWK